MHGGQWNEGLYWGQADSAKCIWRPGQSVHKGQLVHRGQWVSQIKRVMGLGCTVVKKSGCCGFGESHSVVACVSCCLVDL